MLLISHEVWNKSSINFFIAEIPVIIYFTQRWWKHYCPQCPTHDDQSIVLEMSNTYMLMFKAHYRIWHAVYWCPQIIPIRTLKILSLRYCIIRMLYPGVCSLGSGVISFCTNLTMLQSDNNIYYAISVKRVHGKSKCFLLWTCTGRGIWNIVSILVFHPGMCTSTRKEIIVRHPLI